MFKSAMASWSKSDLKDLVAYFEEALGWEFNVEEFDDRFKMQKYVYFAREYGLDVPYEYNIYRHGPYSPALAEDYYEISGTGDADRGAGMFDSDSFERLVKDRGNDWLEIAATIQQMERNFKAFKPPKDTPEKIIKRVANMKEEPEEKVKHIYEELHDAL